MVFLIILQFALRSYINAWFNVWKSEFCTVGNNSKISTDWGYIWISILKRCWCVETVSCWVIWCFPFQSQLLRTHSPSSSITLQPKCVLSFFIPSSFDLIKNTLAWFLFVIQCLEKLMNAICRKCIYCSYVWSLPGLDSKRKKNSDRWQK